LGYFFIACEAYYSCAFWVGTPAEVGVGLDGEVAGEDLVFFEYGVAYVEFYCLGGEELIAVRTLQMLDSKVDDFLI
jgi:hypothetical protein